MKVRKVELKKDCTIVFATEQNIKQNQFLELDYLGLGQKHYFKVTEIETISDITIMVKAVEVGYWSILLSRKPSFDVRDLIDSELTLVTDQDKIDEINKKSKLC